MGQGEFVSHYPFAEDAFVSTISYRIEHRLDTDFGRKLTIDRKFVKVGIGRDLVSMASILIEGHDSIEEK